MVTKVSHGIYRMSDESPQEVALKVYGDVSRYAILLKYNEDWGAEPTVIVPNKEGRTITVEEGDTLKTIINRLFPGQFYHMYIDKYNVWNAGTPVEELVGETVFVPER